MGVCASTVIKQSKFACCMFSILHAIVELSYATADQHFCPTFHYTICPWSFFRFHLSHLAVVQAVRGGRTKLAHLTAPQAEYQHEQKGDALHAMELALSLEKLNFQKLRHLHDVAEESKDAQMSDFVEDMLADQVCPACWLYQAVVPMSSFGH